MSASIIPYPGLPQEAPALPDSKTLVEEYYTGKVERQVREVLHNPKACEILQIVLDSLSDGVRRESIKLPRHSCVISQTQFSDLAAVAGFYHNEPLEGHFLRWHSAYLLPRVEAVHPASKIMRLYVLPDSQKPDFLAMQFERAVVRNLRFIESAERYLRTIESRRYWRSRNS
jgi:hypothetical protein